MMSLLMWLADFKNILTHKIFLVVCLVQPLLTTFLLVILSITWNWGEVLVGTFQRQYPLAKFCTYYMLNLDLYGDHFLLNLKGNVTSLWLNETHVKFKHNRYPILRTNFCLATYLVPASVSVLRVWSTIFM